MVIVASFFCSEVTPFTSTLSQTSHLLPFRPFNKHLQRKGLSLKNSLAQSNSRLILSSPNNPFRTDSAIPSLSPSSSRIIRPTRCSISNSTAPADSDAPIPLLNSLKTALSQLTPVDICKWQKLLFCAGVAVGHCLAAFEAPELHLVPGGWGNTLGIWGLIVLAVFMQFRSTLYLAKYSEKVVVPTAVVQFGPYRFLWHPIYASTVLLFVAYFAALRAPMSMLFVVGVCLVYYGEKAKMEEGLMLETFGERYSEYTSKVRYRLIPFLY